MFNREKAIETLVSDDVQTITFMVKTFQTSDYLNAILRDGTKGYVDYTDEELMSELQDRDISYLFGETE